MEKRTAVLITGASRGFGRCLALDFARELASSDLDLFLWARDEKSLQETSRLVQQAQISLEQRKKLQLFIQSVDLSDSADYMEKADILLKELTSAGHYDRVILVHNAGAVGNLGLAQECPPPIEVSRHFELNVTSVMWLNKRFLDVFGASRGEIFSATANQAQGSNNTTKLIVVNVSSRAAIAPYKTFNLYCTAKAAREMHFRVLALEQACCNKVRVLSYSPGAMDTDIQQTVRESPLMAPELKQWFVEMKEEGTLVPTEKSSRRVVIVTINEDFESGKHITFDDLSYVDQA
ncbi:hypothetical protein PsorP6_011159 [Peronosclerospora sorghi]|uniref:Uncharacterized protein n=1 Tax=Peronosclerospora sorghi TaxID=230839 RepID=A0ACC0VUZ3_9STRA|nr:hypothetical protein PsorP6_011159 [Peronosclerospora sorghi]